MEDIKSRIQKDRMAAMRAQDSTRKATLDYILGEIQKKEKDLSAKGDIATAIIQAYTKSLKEFIEQHGTDRPEQAEAFRKEIEILSDYLPRQLSDDELKAEVAAMQASGVTAKGLIMKGLKEKHGAAVDGKRAQALLTEMGIS